MVLAAGQGSRLAQATGGRPKQFLEWRGSPLYWHSVLTFGRCAAVDGVVLVFPPDVLESERERVAGLSRRDALGLPLRTVAGGPRRQDSVRHGLAGLPPEAEFVLVHDGARPFLAPGLVHRVAEALRNAPGAIPALPVTDTVKEIRKGNDGRDVVAGTLPREGLVAVQTPQGFVVRLLREAHERAGERDVTDDASLMEEAGHEIRIVEGDPRNVKITRPEDLALIADPEVLCTVAGLGYDVHRFAKGGEEGRPLKLGGIPIPGDMRVLAHSDGDVLLHAVMDAILGAAGLGDIGRHFPDDDPAMEGVSSALLLDRTLELAAGSGVRPFHADVTVIAQRPKVQPFRDEIRGNLARLLQLPRERVNVKATTEEGLGFTGRMEGIKASALVTCRLTPQTTHP
ncbi:MAG: 2-C-methyl-D-erythritol 4-phosphate cytidylyltransferase [Desulfovibrio sp.]|nr:2-C-methyl-D-erythritol 4-phosphate cytidylyltransferase [Desulfovibrio sp.]